VVCSGSCVAPLDEGGAGDFELSLLDVDAIVPVSTVPGGRSVDVGSGRVWRTPRDPGLEQEVT